MLTFQDFMQVQDTPAAKAEFVEKLISQHNSSQEVKMAREADEYYAQRNITITRYAKMLYTMTGRQVPDFTAADNRIASNFFFTMNTRRCTYSLGNGVEFDGKDTKAKLGLRFDTRLKDAADYALIHGCSFLLWNKDELVVFKLTEFAPLLDEYTGALRAGVRFWQLDENRPMIAVLYEEDGYTKFAKKKGEKMELLEEKRAYKLKVAKAPADAEAEVVGTENYSALPIVPMWGSKLHQSTLVGLKQSIDAYDLIRSGFANDMQECAQVYWVLENYNGMKDGDLIQFRDRLKLLHIATADTGDGGKVTPHVQEVPHEANIAFLKEIRAGMFEDFGLLDLRTLSAAATNDHIAAAYQAQNDMADDFEYQVIDAVQNLLRLLGVDDTPKFKRGQLINTKEQVETLVMEAGIVDMPDELLVEKFPNFTPEEVEKVRGMMIETAAKRVNMTPPKKEDPEQEGDA